jgi:hypothetical protein
MIIINYGTDQGITTYRVNGSREELNQLVDELIQSPDHAIVEKSEIEEVWKNHTIYLKVLKKIPFYIGTKKERS